MVNGHGILALPKDACNHVIGQGSNGGGKFRKNIIHLTREKVHLLKIQRRRVSWSSDEVHTQGELERIQKEPTP